MGIQIYRFII